MSNLIEPAPEETDGQTGGPNRAFILIALGLAGLLVLGLLGVFVYVAGTRLGVFGSRPDAVATPAPTASVVATRNGGTPRASGGTPVAATTASAVAPTATLVIGGPTPPAAGTPAAATRLPGSATTAPTTVAQAQATGTTAAVSAATATPGSSGSTTAATATVTGGSSGKALPTTGADLDIVVIAVLFVLLLVLARSFRSVLRG